MKKQNGIVLNIDDVKQLVKNTHPELEVIHKWVEPSDCSAGSNIIFKYKEKYYFYYFFYHFDYKTNKQIAPWEKNYGDFSGVVDFVHDHTRHECHEVILEKRDVWEFTTDKNYHLFVEDVPE